MNNKHLVAYFLKVKVSSIDVIISLVTTVRNYINNK